MADCEGCGNSGSCHKQSKFAPQPEKKGMSLEQMKIHEQNAVKNRTFGIGIDAIFRMQQKQR
jgi:hypothetical protein